MYTQSSLEDGLSLLPECPAFVELVAGIEDGDPASVRHAGSCPDCRTELNMYALFMMADSSAEDSDVQWVVHGLRNSDLLNKE